MQRELGGQQALARLVEIPPDCPRSPIISLMTPHPRSLAQHCQDAGFVVRAVVAPTVPEGTERVRLCLHSGNTEEQVTAFVRTVRRWLEDRIEGVQYSAASCSEMKARL